MSRLLSWLCSFSMYRIIVQFLLADILIFIATYCLYYVDAVVIMINKGNLT